jgi:outer membrane protein assembly factor BamB
MTNYRDDGELARLQLIRLTDHRVIWDQPTPGARNLAVGYAGDRPDKIVTAGDNGEVVIYRFADGSVLTKARIPWARPDPQQGIFTDLVPSQGYLAVNRTEPHTSIMTVYRMDTMAQLWRTDRTGGFAFDCAPAFCVNAGNGMVAYDAATGAVRWQLPDTVGALTTGADRVVLSNGSEDGTSYLIDATTGARIGPPALGSTVWDAHPDGALLLLRSTTTPADRTSVTRWDLTTGRQDVLGTMDKMLGYRCEAVRRFLTCQRGNQFQVTAVR